MNNSIKPTKEQEMIQNIKKLYSEINNQKEFCLLLSKEFELKPNSIRTNWLSTYYSVPDKYQARVIEILQKTIKQQNNRKQMQSV
jgi:hypothetical protein